VAGSVPSGDGQPGQTPASVPPGTGDEASAGFDTPAAGGAGAPDDAPLDAPAADLADPPAGAGDGRAGADDPPVDAPADAPLDALADTEPAETDPIMMLTQERDDYREALIRLQADFENYKKRMIKQQTDHLERAATALVDKLLPVLDTADLAVAHGAGEDVKQLSGALSTVLEREGLERIDPVGHPFDPTEHDAVAHEPSDDGHQEVVEVMRAGYRWKGRVLRPAMVKVRG
jgi:molecular chaperone GrpE